VSFCEASRTATLSVGVVKSGAFEMKYFAYGSNLDLLQMAQRCPNAKVIGPAQLTNHRLCFPRSSPVRGCAVASIEPHEGHVIWGVIYELDADDLHRLDSREGYDPVNLAGVNRYEREEIVVAHKQGEKVDAVVYIAVPEDDPGRPSSGYMRHIIEGAVAHSFPDDYIEMLRAVEVAVDEYATLDYLDEYEEPEAESEFEAEADDEPDDRYEDDRDD